MLPIVFLERPDRILTAILDLVCVTMNWLFNDGGRAVCGYVGLAGDCVPRAIAIATGLSYRVVYDELRSLSQRSPRAGVYSADSHEYLERLGWTWNPCVEKPLGQLQLSHRVSIVSFVNDRGVGHLAAIIDQTIHDTWNPSDVDDFRVRGYWTPPGDGNTIPETNLTGRDGSWQDSETQAEYEKVLRRLRALSNTANNHASTIHEQHNAIRMMQTLMLRHNLRQEDIDDTRDPQLSPFTTMACVLNGSRACQWEHDLARYVTMEVFPHVQYYSARRGHRTILWFYGPLEDVENSIAVFRELLLTIASSAKLLFRGYARGSGASYCEGFVNGLPRSNQLDAVQSNSNALSLLQKRSLIVHRLAKRWLDVECDIRLVSSSNVLRNEVDHEAERRGRVDGAKQELPVPKRTLRLPVK